MPVSFVVCAGAGARAGVGARARARARSGARVNKRGADTQAHRQIHPTSVTESFAGVARLSVCVAKLPYANHHRCRAPTTAAVRHHRCCRAGQKLPFPALATNQVLKHFCR